MNSPPAPPDTFRLLGDPLRWRLLRLLARERLNVSELTAALALAQSGVSRHLGLLREAGLVVEQSRAGWTWCALPSSAPPGLDGLWEPLRARWSAAPDAHGDDARLADVLRARAERGEGWDGPSARGGEPGRSWAAWAHALGHWLPPARVVHLGAGTGALTREVARWATAVLGVDPDPRAVALARTRSGDAPRATYLAAPLTAVPRPDGAFERALVAQALAPVERPEAVLAEAVRLVAPGGSVLVLDLLPHGEAWVRERLGHRRQGVSPGRLGAWLEGAGLSRVRVEPEPRRRGDPFVVLVGSGVKPPVGAGARAVAGRSR